MSRRAFAGVAAVSMIITTVVVVPWANQGTPSELVLTRPATSTSTTSTTTTTAPPPSTTSPPATVALIPAAPAPPRQEGRFRSTAYCLTGGMASGRPTYVGAVAGNRWAIGTVLTAWPNPWGDPDMRFTVEDRHEDADADGYPTQLDFAMPGECDRATTWGNRHKVTVHVTGAQL